MKSGSKVTVVACTGIVVLFLGVASAAVAETSIDENTTRETISPAAERISERETSVRVETVDEKALAARQSENVPETIVSTRSPTVSVQVASSESRNREARMLGGEISSQARVATSQVRSRQIMRTTRNIGNLAVRVQTASRAAPTAVVSEPSVTPGGVDNGQDALRSGDQPQRTRQVQFRRVVSSGAEPDGTGDLGVTEHRETKAHKAVRRQAAPPRPATRLTTDPKKVKNELRKLQVSEQRNLIALEPATVSSPAAAPANRSKELRIARQDITARSVSRISSQHYEKLYRQAARDYGFADDWYILAAVGKVESNHGRNLGPSSAGAMGPMQFLPSTWQAYGLDGNGDREANIMDPEDAIPAAARYLRAGGAPEDWYAALYTYNRAGWYVEKVLRVAEAYRKLAEDSTVGPYS